MKETTSIEMEEQIVLLNDDLKQRSGELNHALDQIKTVQGQIECLSGENTQFKDQIACLKQEFSEKAS